MVEGTLFKSFERFKNYRRYQRALTTELRDFLISLLPGFKDPRIALPLVTDVLSLLDYSLLVSTSPIRGATNSNLVRFRELMEQAIFDVIYPPYRGREIPEDLQRFTDLLIAVRKTRPVGIVTSNFDMALEEQLQYRIRDPAREPHEPIEAKFDFGFAWRDPRTDRGQRGPGKIWPRPSDPVFKFYKLHGSVSWLRCYACEHTYINMWGLSGGWGYAPALRVNERLSQQGLIIQKTTCHCDHRPLRPVLVAPSLVRDIRNPDLLETWKHSLELLRTAGEWWIIGYSFPPEDLAIRSLFMRAWQSRSDRPRVTVVQHGGNRATRARYRLMFPDCKYLTFGLEGFLRRQLEPLGAPAN
jgi:hypothetical protein